MLCKSLILVSKDDEGAPEAHHFRVDEQQVDIEEMVVGMPEGSILVRLLVVSTDPYLRVLIKSDGSEEVGLPMQCYCAGKVLCSKNQQWTEGDLFGANLPVITVQLVTQDTLSKAHVWKLSGLLDEEHISLGVGILGMPGSAAYAGIVDVLRPHPGETIFITSAAGAVGSMAGMIAKQVFQCKVIGSAGGREKCDFVVDTLGFDHCIDYKQAHNADELAQMLKELAPEGIDMCLENVGGMHFGAALACLRPHGSIAICGQVSDYNKIAIAKYEVELWSILLKSQRIEGFLCFDWLTGKRGHFLSDMSSWIKEGKVRPHETAFHGLASWPQAFISLFAGQHLGKVVIYVD